MKKKKLFRIVVVVSAITLILFGTLVVHIAMVTNPKDKPHYGVQLSRIDFKTPLDSLQANEVSAFVKSIKGVGNTMYNYQYHNLVFSHQVEIISGQEVYEKLVAEKHVDATRFFMTPEEIAKTAKCPVMTEKSVLMSLAHQVQLYFL